MESSGKLLGCNSPLTQNRTMNEQTDKRRGHTSASNAAADRLCPGRHNAQKGLEETESAEASQGTLIHDVFAGLKEESVLDADSAKTLRRAHEIESIILGNWLCGIDVKGPAGRCVLAS